MTAEYVFDVPPAILVTMNQRTHWAARSRKLAALRTRGAVAYVANPHRMEQAHRAVTVTFKDRRRRDDENLAPTVKALTDGLVSGVPHIPTGLLPDDDHRHILSTVWRVTEPDRALDGVRITLTFTPLES